MCVLFGVVAFGLSANQVEDTRRSCARAQHARPVEAAAAGVDNWEVLSVDHLVFDLVEQMTAIGFPVDATIWLCFGGEGHLDRLGQLDVIIRRAALGQSVSDGVALLVVERKFVKCNLTVVRGCSHPWRRQAAVISNLENYPCQPISVSTLLGDGDLSQRDVGDGVGLVGCASGDGFLGVNDFDKFFLVFIFSKVF